MGSELYNVSVSGIFGRANFSTRPMSPNLDNVGLFMFAVKRA